MVHLRFVAALVLKILMWGGIASIAWIGFSCEEFCEESNRTAVVVSFYAETSGASLPVKVNIKGIENDSTLYANTSYSQVMLPVNPSADVMSYLIQNDTLAIDTILIRYTRHDGFISPKCGCVSYAEIQGKPDITNNSITRMEVINPNVTTVSYRQDVVNAENIRIYY